MFTVRDVSTPLDMTKGMTRREATWVIGGTIAGLFLPLRVEAATEPSEMLTRAIPTSGEKLPVIGLGSWQVFDVDLSPENEKQLGEVLSLFVKLGGRVVDSSPMYGRSEQVIGTLAAKLGLRDKLFFATKVWTRGKQSGVESMERSLTRFQTKRIDLMQVHNLVANRPFGGGNLFSRVRSKPLPQWAAEFDCHSWAQFFLKWMIANPAVTCAIPATNNPQHLEDNMQAGRGRLPDAQMRRQMTEFVSAI
jgi:diketogulonate reductase-like aldo/keto reductase